MSKSIFEEFTIAWTRLVQIFAVIIIVATIFMFFGFSVIPSFSESAYTSCNISSISQETIVMCVCAWFLPSLFVVIILACAYVAFCKWLWRVSDKLTRNVQSRLIAHHTARLERKREIERRNKERS